jgi:hypothetical protein
MIQSFVGFAASLILFAGSVGSAAAGEYAVFKSVDRGRSWIRSDAGMPHRSRINAFASADEAVFAGTDSGIYVSTNQARSWERATGAALSSCRVISLAALGQRVFAGTDGDGIMISEDKGQRWVPNTAFPAKKVRCLLAFDGNLYAGTERSGVFFSNDGGHSWAELPGLPAHSQVFALSAVDGRLFAGLYSQGLYSWIGQNRHWERVGPVFPLVLAAIDHTLVAGHNPGGLYWSDDLGASWSKGTASSSKTFLAPVAKGSGDLPAEAPVWELASDNELIFAGAASGIYYSEDRGRTWAGAATGLPPDSPGVAFLVKRALVLAATPFSSSGGN